MKPLNILYFTFCILILPACNNSKENTFIAATYNIRYLNESDKATWEERCKHITELIKYHEFDLFGTQEGLPEQLADLKTALPQFDFYGQGRDGGNKGEHSAIFYKTEKYILLDKGDFWLSATPDKPSLSWDATCCNRICTWVKFQDKETKSIFFVFNAHYDYEKDYARCQSSILVLNKIKEIAKDSPVIFMGDLNGNTKDKWCKIITGSGILHDSYSDVENPYTPDGSYNAFGIKEDLEWYDYYNAEKQANIGEYLVIDHIYLSKHFKAKKWGILTDSYAAGKFPSDHFPLAVKICYNPMPLYR
ncbi:MAG: endonuclease/exonuclease/phosphatase family protein [Bacteroidales bacterium]|jgi:endonuclease/exonuclease/phosphatase family metal-dependent hydrolase|nr:endonuclease/exonuclease/phosphatase family protein [Bacteroidales bacterium]